MELNLAYLHSEHLGYGRAGISLADALKARGVTVHDQRLGVGEQERPAQAATACWFSYPTHARGWYEGQYAASYCMFETDSLPEAMRGVLDSFDLILVPSQHNVDLFSRWHPNVKYVPLGINPQVWKPTARQDPDRYFRVLTSGSGARKGIDLTRRAFTTVFPDGSWGDGPIPTLQIKSLKYGPQAAPRIEPVIGILSVANEVNLYAQAHVYVGASRGEGFGLQPLQAIAQGLPTILTDAHGHKAFSQYGMGLSATLEHNSVAGGYFSLGESGDWWEPSFDELCDWLLFCYENYDDVRDVAWDNAHLAGAQFTWDKTAAAFIDAFPAGQLERPAVLGKYVPLAQRNYRVRVDQPRRMEIAGTVHQFDPGQDYWEPADIKRFMFDAGWLDPDCLTDEDAGLTDAQVALLDVYRSDKAFCSHCGQQYNSGVMREVAS